MEFADVVRRRRMTRAFRPDPVAPGDLDALVELASRAPSAGKAQGWHLVVLEGAETARFWELTLPAERRPTFRFPGLLEAPVIALAYADPTAYLERYSEPDKQSSGLGDDLAAWPAPYWTIDTAMAVMTLLLAATDRGLGALFFGVFHHLDELREELGVPAELELIGAIALGVPADPAATPPGRSASRSRRRADEIIHRGGW